MQIHPTQRNVVVMQEIGMTTTQLLALFPDATWNNSHNAWRVANTLFVAPPFTLNTTTKGDRQ